MRAAVYTLGCKLNQCESEALASSFDSRGFFIGPASEDADIYIINTCTVTTKAEQKARRMIRKLSGEHPESAVLVTGCYAQLDSADLKLADNVIVVPHDYKDDINRLPSHLEEQGISPGIDFAPRIRAFFEGDTGTAPDPDRFWYDSVDFNYHTRAFLKVQDGCNNSCAYCRVTIARGDSVSLGVDDVMKQFTALQQKGYREVVLTGVNLTSYNSGGIDFTALLDELTAEASRSVKAGNPSVRIRLSSLEPETIDERMARAVESPFVCPHFHIPVQSGSDRILNLMRRHNDRSRIISAVERLREAKYDPYIAADVIAGFPGETDEDFEQTRSLLEDCNFTFLHVFPYSSRPGTAAAAMKNQVPQRISGERTNILRKLSARNSADYAERWLGREIEVLLEQKKGQNWLGTSGNYLKTEVCDILNNNGDDNREGGLCRAGILSTENGIRCEFLKWV
ncbi:MAG: tRNA (N(6)-L-threonylcarbamoyladenosine(37)-C(2))-methylthiotransferase MtaB [Spirochaetales bacterium]|uniref:tRNA (N(6)-L-threonylcarbamoyladenosine(37)-C(2))-methylthiotransferase MtaB n=1 Tax=Candidatus Thalassospirochaeta sargassi TaxID=3119039 RepID=A0AAJ1IDS7_9SPIO|nr:tRNA (N(6)-L-threonylcarbamoyladenosine(37)-C(2))-methylthiotransferase MtaB [Spirochaetales bacterium]